MVTKSSFELYIFDSEPYFASLTPLFRVSVLKMTGLRFTKSSKVDFVTILGVRTVTWTAAYAASPNRLLRLSIVS